MDNQENNQHNSEIDQPQDGSAPGEPLHPEDATSDNRPEAAEAAEPEVTVQQWLMRNLPYLLVGAALVALIYNFQGVAGLIGWGQVLLGLGFVVFIHELGHFLVAKWCGVQVDVFSIGFGPAIPGCRYKWGETTYKLAIIPLGGYVQMLGQIDLHEEDDGSEDDPRSYKNKPVWQRMAIISAGVVMNAIFGAVCFVLVFWGPGKMRLAPVIASIDSGSASFEGRLRWGATIENVNGIEKPYFDNLKREVLVTHINGSSLPIAYKRDDQALQTCSLIPRLNATTGLPAVGIAPAGRLQFQEGWLRPNFKGPVVAGSAASRAEPPFKFDDNIVAMTDPTDPNTITELPEDKRLNKKDPNYGQKDYFEFLRRLQLLQDKKIVIQVEREKTPGETETVNITVEPAYHRILGGVMDMGEIVALRDDSPAAKAGVQKRNKIKNIKGDLITAVEVVEPDGTSVTRFAHKPKENDKRPKGSVTIKPLDPARLPSQLRAWAKRMEQAGIPQAEWRDVELSARRHNPPAGNGKKKGADFREFDEKTLSLKWDNDWRFDRVVPVYSDSPLAIAELGFGYQVKTTVVGVDGRFKGGQKAAFLTAQCLGSQAMKPTGFGSSLVAASQLLSAAKIMESSAFSQLQKNDIITHVQIHHIVDSEGTVDAEKWIDLSGEKQDNWAHYLWALQSADITKISLKVSRNGKPAEVNIVPHVDKTWPRHVRGFLVMPDTRLQHASGFPEAVSMGLVETRDRFMDVFLSIRGLATRRISTKGIAGPVTIASMAYQTARFDFVELVMLIAFISINLAIINFLPIPVLDGGHMVFLTYELIRGKPASENIRALATYAGLLLILLLFVLVTFQDILREIAKLS